VDAKLGITSRLMLDATVNPDFGQVEADQVELNLSRFETFFPEKRPFFLEGADVYQTPFQLFYSRRIGKPLSGVQAEDELALGGGAEVTVVAPPGVPRIWAASKLTGALTRDLSIGLLAAVVGPERAIVRDAAGAERELELAPERSFGVLRLRHALGDGLTSARWPPRSTAWGIGRSCRPRPTTTPTARAWTASGTPRTGACG
jgi:hypothetical protein